MAYSRTPFGYRRIDDRLVPNREEQQIVRRVIRLHERHGFGFKAIAARLTNDGIPAPRSPKGETRPWGHTTIKSILRASARELDTPAKPNRKRGDA